MTSWPKSASHSWCSVIPTLPSAVAAFEARYAFVPVSLVRRTTHSVLDLEVLLEEERRRYKAPASSQKASRLHCPLLRSEVLDISYRKSIVSLAPGTASDAVERAGTRQPGRMAQTIPGSMARASELHCQSLHSSLLCEMKSLYVFVLESSEECGRICSVRRNCSARSDTLCIRWSELSNSVSFLGDGDRCAQICTFLRTYTFLSENLCTLLDLLF